jgi:beta-glucosidase
MFAYTPLLLLSLLAVLPRAHAQNVIRNDTVLYGQSPLVEPPIANGTGTWAAAYGKARALVSQMSLEEKVNLTGGVSFILNACSGNIPPVQSVGFPGLCLSDAGQGVRGTDFISGFASGISVGAR